LAVLWRPPGGTCSWPPGQEAPIGEPRRRIGCVRRNCRLLVDPKAEEARSVPVRTGDGPRDSREAGIGGLAPDKAIRNHSHGVPLALVFAHEHGAGLEAPWALCPCPVAPREAGKMLCGFRIKPATHLLLDVPAKKPRNEILGEAWWRRRAVGRTPQRTKRVEAECRMRPISASTASRSSNECGMAVRQPCVLTGLSALVRHPSP
jgi:hypothetical protein